MSSCASEKSLFVWFMDKPLMPYHTQQKIIFSTMDRTDSFLSELQLFPELFFPPLKHTDTRLSLNYRRNCYKTS